MRTPKELGASISLLRREHHLTQRALADQLHVTDKAVSRWERGLGYPDYQLLEKLCEVLDVPVEQLLFGKLNPPISSKETNLEAEAASGIKPNPRSTLAAVYEDAEKAYRQKRRKLRRIAAAIIVLLLSVAFLYREHFQPRVCRTLLGTYTTLTGDTVPVQVELDGRFHSFLFQEAKYYSGTLVIETDSSADPLFSRSFVGKDSAEGMDLIGRLTDEDGAYHISSFLYCPELNEFGMMELWFSKDFTKLWIVRNDAMPGELAAASDPYVDMERFRARYAARDSLDE